MSVSEPLALARANELRTSAHDSTSAQTAQDFARHDSISGHANNALLILALMDPASFADPDTREALEGIRRRLAAIVELER